jgi:hypothetical protein
MAMADGDYYGLLSRRPNGQGRSDVNVYGDRAVSIELGSAMIAVVAEIVHDPAAGDDRCRIMVTNPHGRSKVIFDRYANELVEEYKDEPWLHNLP